MKRYVLGFLFDADESLVALVKKNRPEWQKGLCNGIGGHVEPGESFDAAMVREFEEETGVVVFGGWTKFAITGGDDWEMHCYRSSEPGAIEAVSSFNDVGELIQSYYVDSVLTGQVRVVHNLRFLVPMALTDSSHRWPYVISSTRPSDAPNTESES